jgi:hypothetical protein
MERTVYPAIWEKKMCSATYISGSLLMSAIAAIGIPKLLAGPQKSSNCQSISLTSFSLTLVFSARLFHIARLFPSSSSIVCGADPKTGKTYESSRSSLCTCWSESSR